MDGCSHRDIILHNGTIEMNTFLANLIFILHILFILFYVVVPFLNIKKHPELHILHLCTGPLLFIHWIANSSECALTRLEMFFRGETEQSNSFFFNLVNPIYKPAGDHEIRQLIWVLSIGLWLITLTKFIKNPCVMTDFIRDVKAGRRRPSPDAFDQQPDIERQVVIVQRAA